MKAYQCSQCGHVQETRNAMQAGDESLDVCEACASLETMKIVVIEPDDLGDKFFLSKMTLG